MVYRIILRVCQTLYIVSPEATKRVSRPAPYCFPFSLLKPPHTSSPYFPAPNQVSGDPVPVLKYDRILVHSELALDS